ncbi:MAG: heme ABC transporter permease CcmC [Pseudomonadota bacterium]
MMKQYASLKVFYSLAGRLMPWFGWAFALLGISGLCWGLFLAPTDAVQGEAYRIMFVHVPSAWMSLMIYAVMTLCAMATLIRRPKIAGYWLLGSSRLGASFTFLTLFTGSLWGRPTWGAWWVWDARLTSELLLLFIYLGIIALESAIPEKRKAARVVGMLTVVGSVNLPIIKFSVDWWTTLHQPASLFRTGGSAIHPMMLTALLLMAASFTCYYFWLVLWRVRISIREKEQP